MSTRRSGPGAKNDITDILGLRVGHANDSLACTGVTAVIFDQPSIVAGDVRGGGPGSRETDLLDPSTLVERADAIILSGGSSYGLGAADGAASWLGQQGRGFQLVGREGVPPSPIVPAAILYDLANGGDKNWSKRNDGYPPYFKLGEQACMSARQFNKESSAKLAQGVVGAGYGAIAGLNKGGLGSASYITDNGIKVGALIAVNSFGSVKLPGDEAYWAWPYEWNDEFGGIKPNLALGPCADLPDDTKLGPLGFGHKATSNDASDGASNEAMNTTIGVIAIQMPDASRLISQANMKRVAVMAQDGLARAIRPIHGPTDGDILFTACVEEPDTTDLPQNGIPIDPITLTRIGSIAADVTARAIARAIYEAEKEAT
ncbi:MAG: P1 family peptidase [Pseudomonadota bacterium]